MSTTPINHKNFFYPPGGILIWLIIFVELFTFGAALITLVNQAALDPVLFHESRLQLNVAFGTVNTILLLTSGFFMANTVYELKQKNNTTAKKYLLATMLFGVFFLVLKSVEYASKIDAGLVLGYNSFFTFYWLLTLFHIIHLLVGLAILASFYFTLKKDANQLDMQDVEAGAAFWHMCDLIWLLLFPVMYLIF